MPYLTFNEFNSITGNTSLGEDQFKMFLPSASAVLDNITNHYYQFNDLESDEISFRKKQFKLAICAEILYFSEVGGSTYESINNEPQTFSVGRTSVSNSSRYNPSGANESRSLVAEEVYIYLEGTGLLYRGTASC